MDDLSKKVVDREILRRIDVLGLKKMLIKPFFYVKSEKNHYTDGKFKISAQETFFKNPPNTALEQTATNKMQKKLSDL